jgi:hypothetical protein
MTALVHSIASTSINARIVSTGLTAKVHLVKFACYFNDLMDGSSWGGSQEKAEETVENRKIAYARMLRKMKEKDQELPKYIINCSGTDLKEGGVDGHYVCLVPEKIKEDKFEGVFDEYDLEDFEEVGVILKVGKKWIIVQDKVQLELMRRQINIKKIQLGQIQFCNYCNKDDEYDTTPYREHLKEIDEENGGEIKIHYDLMLSNAKMDSKTTVNELINVNEYI